MSDPRFVPVEVGGHTFRALDLDHEAVSGRVRDEMRAGVDVYYDRRWALTRAFCRFLLDRPELVRGRTVLAAGAGVGLEAVVLASLARRVILNDRAPVSLELAAEQLRANGIRDFGVEEGLFQEAALEDVELVVACFVVYDEETRDAMVRLLERNEDIEGRFAEVLERVGGPVAELAAPGDGRIVRVG